MFISVGLIALFSAIVLVAGRCYEPSPAFPVPLWHHGSAGFEIAFDTMHQRLTALISAKKYDISSFSIEVTSNTDTLWAHHHTARERNVTRPGAEHVSGKSVYRIASITKTFTTLGLLYQHAAGNLSLDDSVDQYIPEFAGSDSGEIPWKDITLRILASQLSGLPRELAQSDLLNELPDPTTVGLPPASREGLPQCYQYDSYSPCNRSDLLNNLKKRSPLFAPNQKSTYSNLNFELLGLVLENVTGVSYGNYIREAVFEPLGMKSSSLQTPSDDQAVLPLGQYFWDVDEGIHAPTGGIYSSSADMSKYVRYIMTHYNALATGVNWMMPASWSGGVDSFYGMPFEILRTERILEETERPVTFVTKAGGVPMYFSRISIMPEYGLGFTILTAGDDSLLDAIQDIVVVELTRAAEAQIWRDMQVGYAGVYTSTNSSLNSSLEIVSSPSFGLVLKSFISNGTDVFTTVLAEYAGADADQPWHAQLMPTLLFKNETAPEGEIWRLLVVPERRDGPRPIFDDLCLTDVDPASYAGLPINEFVFWHESGIVELPAWKVAMKRSNKSHGADELLVQQL